MFSLLPYGFCKSLFYMFIFWCFPYFQMGLVSVFSLWSYFYVFIFYIFIFLCFPYFQMGLVSVFSLCSYFYVFIFYIFIFLCFPYFQMGLVSVFRDETLDALKSYVKLLAKYFPGEHKNATFWNVFPLLEFFFIGYYFCKIWLNMKIRTSSYQSQGKP